VSTDEPELDDADWYTARGQVEVPPLTVAALYVEKGGAYFVLEHVDPWDEERDARLYAGPYPVVAHPPCNKWSLLAYINRQRIPGYEIGDDGGCFAAALEAVRTFGGVLEHPAGSLAWKHYGLDKPERGIWKGYFGSWVTEVDQGRYGHVARKRTWLYVVGGSVPDPLDWEPADSSVIVSGFTHQPKGKHVACEYRRVRPKEASRTPAAFRDVLLGIARSSARGEVDALKDGTGHDGFLAEPASQGVGRR
jgi:hypothetical protein